MVIRSIISPARWRAANNILPVKQRQSQNVDSWTVYFASQHCNRPFLFSCEILPVAYFSDIKIFLYKRYRYLLNCLLGVPQISLTICGARFHLIFTYIIIFIFEFLVPYFFTNKKKNQPKTSNKNLHYLGAGLNSSRSRSFILGGGVLRHGAALPTSRERPSQ